MPDPMFDDLPILEELGFALDAAFEADAAAQPAAVTPARPQRWWRFPGFLATFAFLTIGVGTAAATLTALTGSPIPVPRSADVQPPMTVVTGSHVVLPLRAADPSGAGLPYALRLSRSEAGLVCTTVGQAEGDRFGVVGNDGRFRTMPEGRVDGCGEASDNEIAVLGARTFDAPRARDVRTLVYGAGGDALASASASIRGVQRKLAVDDNGNFLLALAGYPEDNGIRVTLRFKNGRTTVQSLATGFGVAADPSGPAWRVTGIGGRTGSCIEIRRVRVSRTTPVLPRACGDSDWTGSAAKTPWYFDLRRFARGDAGSVRAFGEDVRWSWHKAPPRTIVWGGADPGRVRAVRAHGGGVEATGAVGANAAFMVVLPKAIPAAGVTVEVEMKNGQRHTFTQPTNLRTVLPEEPSR